MSNMTVEMVLKLIDQLSAPLRSLTDNFEDSYSRMQKANAQFGGGLNDVGDRLDALHKRMAQMSMTGMGFREIGRRFDELGKPINDATETAMKFEKAIEAVARAGGRLDLRDKLGPKILASSKAGEISWEKLTEGERAFVGAGGGAFLDQLDPVRNRLAQLITASEADSKGVYKLLENYMSVGRLSAESAVNALEQNYAQGKKGAYELRDMVHGLPELYSAAMSLGATGSQAATDLPALLQVLRQVSGTPGRADTMLRQGIKHLTDPESLERIQDELGVDVAGVRRDAVASGRDPLLAIANAISDKLAGLGDAAGKLDSASERIAGGDPEKLGSVAREYNFRAFIDAFSKMRDRLGDYDIWAARPGR